MEILGYIIIGCAFTAVLGLLLWVLSTDDSDVEYDEDHWGI